MSIAAAAMAFAACQKAEIEVVEPAVEGQPFELTAALNATKTVNQGLKTKWAEADTFNVFHAVAGTTDYIADGKFTITDAATGHASGSVASPLDGSYYDWYTIYPYASAIKTPGARESGYVYVGSRSDKAQTQTGNNSTSHLCGAGAPLYGVQKHVNAAFSPKIIQHQLASIVNVHLTNNSEGPITVSSVKFTGTEDIVGSYIVDITGEAPVYTPYRDSYVSATAELTVKDGETIAVGGSADFYILIKPFTAAASSELTLAVNGYAKTATIDSETTFKAGEITKVNFSYDQLIHPVPAGAYAIIAKSGSDYFAVSTAANGTSLRRDRMAVNYAGGETFSTSKAALIWDFAFEGEGYIISNDGQAMTAGKNIIPLDIEGDVVTVADNGDGTYTLTADCGKEGIRLMAMNGTNGFGWYAETTGVNKLYIVPATYVAPTMYTVGIGTTVNGTVSADCTEAEEGQEVSLTITPASGYELDKVSVTTATGAAVTVSDNKFTMPAENVSVTATFKACASTKTWTYSVVKNSSPNFVAGTPVTVNNATWSITMGEKVGAPTSNGAPTNAYSSCGWKWGDSSSKYWKSYTLSTDYFASKKVKSVTVSFLNNGKKTGTMVVKQGSTTIGTTSVEFGQAWTDLKANTTQGTSGTLTIEYSVAQASYIRTITVEYLD